MSDFKSLVSHEIPDALTYQDMQEGVQAVQDAFDIEEKDFDKDEREMAISTAFQIVTIRRVQKKLGRPLSDVEMVEALDIVSKDLAQYSANPDNEIDTRDK